MRENYTNNASRDPYCSCSYEFHHMQLDAMLKMPLLKASTVNKYQQKKKHLNDCFVLPTSQFDANFRLRRHTDTPRDFLFRIIHVIVYPRCCCYYHTVQKSEHARETRLANVYLSIHFSRPRRCDVKHSTRGWGRTCWMLVDWLTSSHLVACSFFFYACTLYCVFLLYIVSCPYVRYHKDSFAHTWVAASQVGGGNKGRGKMRRYNRNKCIRSICATPCNMMRKGI